MSHVIHVLDEADIKTHHDEKLAFKRDVEFGLQLANKQISSKYFYDEKGSELFNQITRHNDYYLTRTEIDILDQHKHILSALMRDHAFNLIELGPGEGIKTQILMQQFLQDNLKFRYTPIDISSKYLISLVHLFKQQLPNLKISPIHADYFRGVEWQSEHSERCNLVLFLGSSIGNFSEAATYEFLRHLWMALHDGDYVLLGFDLRKNVDILLRAYADSDGITRDFNLNVLTRINRELGGNFDTSKFRHYPTYNVYSGAMESYIISQERQWVSVDALEQSFLFEAIEPIHLEYSHKYSMNQIENFAKQSGFSILKNFFDEKHYFVDSLWQVNKKMLK